MRILVDYRPALRSRSGVGEYAHQVARHLALDYPADSVTLFTSSWKDRPDPQLARTWPGVRVSDHRVPVRLLNFAWHNLEWPPVEWLTSGRYDVVLSSHPLLTPSRRAAQVVTIHDIDFLAHPERTTGEVRRDYPRLAGDHARRAGRVIVPSRHTASDVTRVLGVPEERVILCPLGAPTWSDPTTGPSPDGYILFMGTLEPRKNVGALLDAYGRLLSRHPALPRLVLAGSPGAGARAWLDAIARPPLARHVEHIGYVNEGDRQRVYCGARLLVMPSLNEGFGMPALEAMSLGIPVVASDRGALPEVVGDAGLIASSTDGDALDRAIERVLMEPGLGASLGRRGYERARQFNWHKTAKAVHQALEEAIDARAHRN
jgi:glycosyltransferase involved in cell wall biosynthesis